MWSSSLLALTLRTLTLWSSPLLACALRTLTLRSSSLLALALRTLTLRSSSLLACALRTLTLRSNSLLILALHFAYLLSISTIFINLSIFFSCFRNSLLSIIYFRCCNYYFIFFASKGICYNLPCSFINAAHMTFYFYFVSCQYIYNHLTGCSKFFCYFKNSILTHLSTSKHSMGNPYFAIILAKLTSKTAIAVRFAFPIASPSCVRVNPSNTFTELNSAK